jgi:hypothetical protein
LSLLASLFFEESLCNATQLLFGQIQLQQAEKRRASAVSRRLLARHSGMSAPFEAADRHALFHAM